MTHLYLFVRGIPAAQNRLVWIPGAGHVPWGSSAPVDVSAVERRELASVVRRVIYERKTNMFNELHKCLKDLKGNF